MKTNTFEEKLYDIFQDLDLRVDSGQAYIYDTSEAIERICELVLNDVIGEDYPADRITDPEIWLEEVSKNRLRAQQRAIIKGGNYED